MIPNQWYAVLESDEVRRGRPVGATRLGEKMVFWRDRLGRVAALRDLCPHRGAALSIGKVRHGNLECPFHGFRFDATGQCRLIPANGRDAAIPAAFRAQAFPTREAYGFVWVWWGEPREALPPLPFFADLRDFRYASFRDHWNVHYTRAIENQLDVVHLPFVHHNTIGRGGKTVVDGPLAELENDELRVWVYNRPDDGASAKRAKDLPAPQRPPYLFFRFPNLWQLRITDDMRIFISFAPVDEENTLLYVRYYQRFLNLPVLGALATQLGRLSSVVIVRQDKRVVLTQWPKKTDITMREKLVPGDRPIVLYRARRRELIMEEAGIGGRGVAAAAGMDGGHERATPFGSPVEE